MSIVDVQIRTISCDQCENTVTFSMKDHQQAVKDNAWLNTSRVVQTGDGRNKLYCSDVCEVKGVNTGEHNIPEPKKIIETPGVGADQAIKIAAQEAKNATEATKAIKSGQPTKLHVVKK